MAIAVCFDMVLLPLHLPQKGLRSAAITQKHIKMALPNTITVTGAGTVSANGTYTPYSGGGDAKWSNGTGFVVSGNGYWAICGQNIYNGARFYSFGPDSNSSTTFPADGTTDQSGIGGSGAAPNPTFTSDGTYPAPQAASGTASDKLFTETAQRGPQTRSRAAAAAALLTTAAFGSVVSGAMTPEPRTLTPVNVVVKLFAPSAQRGPVSLGSRTANIALLSETSPVRGTTLPPVEVTETLLTASASRGPASYALRSGQAGQTLLLTSGGRGGRVSPAGTTAVPIVINEPPLLSVSAARSAVTLAARNAAIPVFTQGVKSGARGITRAVTITLLSAKAQARRITSAPKPEAVDPRDPFQVLRTELLYLVSLKGGSPVAFASTLLAILDNLAASYRTNELNLAANTLAGLPVLIRGGDGVSSTVYGFGQDTPILELLPAADQLIASFVPAKILDALYRPIFTKIDGVLIGMGYASLNVYLASLNASAPASYLVHPNAALLYYLYKNQQGALLLSPGNVFAPQTAFGQSVVGPGAGAVAYTDLSAIPSANTTSPTPGMSAQGYTGSKGIALLVTTVVNGTLVVTAATASGVTWTGDIGNKAAGQTVLMTPGTTGTRAYHVTGVTGSGTATAGAFQVNSVLERVVN